MEKIMALVQTLISVAGPLPLSQTFNAKGDGDVVFYLSGSAWKSYEFTVRDYS